MYKIRKGNFETNSSSADYYREEAEERYRREHPDEDEDDDFLYEALISCNQYIYVKFIFDDDMPDAEREIILSLVEQYVETFECFWNFFYDDIYEFYKRTDESFELIGNSLVKVLIDNRREEITEIISMKYGLDDDRFDQAAYKKCVADMRKDIIDIGHEENIDNIENLVSKIKDISITYEDRIGIEAYDILEILRKF